MFKLMKITTGRYAVVKKEENTSKMPVSFHGYIEVIAMNEFPYWLCISYMQSDELKKSGELDALKVEAADMTMQSIANLEA